MQNASELEQMVNLLALSADVMRKLSIRQDEVEKHRIATLADDIEGVAERLVELLFPDAPSQQ